MSYCQHSHYSVIKLTWWLWTLNHQLFSYLFAFREHPTMHWKSIASVVKQIPNFLRKDTLMALKVAETSIMIINRNYLSNLISSGLHSYNTRNSQDVVTYHCRIDTFKYSFFPWTILEWNKLDLTLHKSSCKVFVNYLLKMIPLTKSCVWHSQSIRSLFTYKIKTGTKSSEWAQI